MTAATTVRIAPGRDFLTDAERDRLAGLVAKYPNVLCDPGPYPVLRATDLIASNLHEYSRNLAVSIVYAVARGEDVQEVAEAFTAAAADYLVQRAEVAS